MATATFNGETITPRRPCDCGANTAKVTTNNGQDVVRCLQCDRWLYNMPRSESGRSPRAARTRENIPPKVKVRVLLRFHSRCVICGSGSSDLHVGHLVSAHDATTHLLDLGVINSESNYAAMCRECNLGLGDLTVPPAVFCRAFSVLVDSGEFTAHQLRSTMESAFTVWGIQ